VGLQPRQERRLFEIPDDVVYLNAASLCPGLRSVRAAGEAALSRRAAPWSITSADWFNDVERLRGLFAELIGADSDGIALVPATSYGLAVAAANLEAAPGERVLLVEEEYPSAVYTWRAFARRTGAELHMIASAEGQSWSEAILAAMDERTRVLSLTNVHWTNGALIDLQAVAGRAHELGAALVLDVSQSAGAMRLDVGELQPDFLVGVGYKWLLGPFGLSYLYVGESHRRGEPIEHNWIVRKGSEDFARLVDYVDEMQPGARRFDAGARTSFILVPMAIAALRQILEWSVPEIEDALAAITGAIESGARSRGLAPLRAGRRAPHMIGIELPEPLGETLGPELASRGVFAGVRSSWLRVAPHLHTTEADLDRFFDALDAALESA
jgi:selenocysteine lyase/cysteine desulfurase